MIKLIKPYIAYGEVEKEFKEIFESGWFTKGKYVDQFKEELKNYTGARYAFLTTSATTALSLCLRIVGIKAGDEVIVSDFSFPATANVVEELGAVPVFADVDLETFNMLPEELEKKISTKTKAVIFVDALGNVSGIHEIKTICQRHGLPLIEDAACAIGSSENGIHSGNIADLTCFSFHPRKLLTTGEGGAIMTNSQQFAEQLEIKLNHGAVMKEGMLDFVDFGYNYRMSELQAVMGIKQLKKLDRIVQERNITKKTITSLIEPLGLVSQKADKNVIHNIQSLVYKVPDAIERDGMIRALRKNGIESTLGTYALSATTYYSQKYNSIQKNAKYLEEKTITLPCYDQVDVNYIADQVKKFLE